MLTRFAPTPSGYLHLGNMVNFVVIDRVAAMHNADIALRIDDADTARTRQEYLVDIFETLAWLGLRWNVGPQAASQMPLWSQHARIFEYRQARDVLYEGGYAYACECTRRDWVAYAGDTCPRSCAHRHLAFEPGSTALRFSASDAAHPIIWRREDLPAYHLASVIDDDALGVDLVVRGADLREATHVQRQISAALPGSRFHASRVIHHPLLLADDGSKMSKSAGARSSPMRRTNAVRDEIDQRAEEMLSRIGDLPRNRGS